MNNQASDISTSSNGDYTDIRLEGGNNTLVQEKRDNESFADVIIRLSKRGKLKDCFGAWDIDDEEEKAMFANLRRHWEKSRLRGIKL